MLSKLRFFRSQNSTELDLLRRSVQPTIAVELLDAETYSFRRLQGGTLNLAFEGISSGKTRKCFKTHLKEAGRLPLRREAAILGAIYGERLDVRNISTPERDWLIMNFVTPATLDQRGSITSNWVDTTIAGATAAMATLGGGDFGEITAAAEGALRFLTDEGEVCGDLIPLLKEHLGGLAGQSHLEPQICHGDLGPRNVMADGTGMILLDWEDVFLGIRGYDWIYWLSFFENRRYLSRDQLLRSGLSEGDARAVLAAILLVKCELSVRSGSIAANAMSTQERLSEALSLQ